MTQATETAEPLAPTAAPCEPSENATLLYYSSDPPPSHVLQASAAILRTTLPVCHATPYASRQSLIPISVLYSLLPRILLRGTQRRPRMTTQGHNLNVRTRKLSPVSSFRADRECGSSGPSTLTIYALSDRSLRAFRAASWALLSAFVLLAQRQRANKTLGDDTGLTCACPLGLVGVGSRPQRRGHDCATSSRSFARPAGAFSRP